MNTTSICQEILQKGFALVSNTFSTFEIDNARILLDKYNNAHNQSLRANSDRDMVHNCHELSIKFLELFESKIIDDILSYLLGPSYLIYAFQSSSLPPQGTNYARRIHCDTPRLIPGYITNIGVIITLDDYTLENGAIEFLPKSFDQTALPPIKQFELKSEKVLCTKGSIIIFNARNYHREGFNHSSNYRHSLTANFCRCYMRQRFDFVRMAQASSLMISLTENQRKLIGYNVRMPSSLDEFFLPAEKRMYLSGQE